MNEEILRNYKINDSIDVERIIDDFYGYVYTIVRNSINSNITDEDIEEIISDIFIAMWKNSDKILETTALKPYLAGIAKNVVRNKYRSLKVNFSINDYEEVIADNNSIYTIVEESEQEKIIQDTLHKLRKEEYRAFILFYYEAKSIKQIASILNLSVSNVKTILYRTRKIIKKNLEKGNYIYGK